MTWKELAKHISEMSEEHQNKPVVISYDIWDDWGVVECITQLEEGDFKNDYNDLNEMLHEHLFNGTLGQRIAQVGDYYLSP